MFVQWAKVTEVHGKAVLTDIDRSKAKAMIKAYGLQLALKNRDGEVYDDGEFYNKYKEGKLKV